MAYGLKVTTQHLCKVIVVVNMLGSWQEENNGKVYKIV